jgi:hypothetical protein
MQRFFNGWHPAPRSTGEGKQGEDSWKDAGDFPTHATMEGSPEMKKAPREPFRMPFLLRAVAYFAEPSFEHFFRQKTF